MVVRPLFRRRAHAALSLGIGMAAALGGCGLPPLASAQPGPAIQSAEPLRTPAAPRIEALLAEPAFAGMQWGILVVDPRTGASIYERNPDLRLVPASNTKVPVTVAALGILGPDYRWDTAFYATTPSIDGIVRGDLYLVGTGDPTLGAPFHDPPESALSALVDSLYANGIRRVSGHLVVDASAWDSTSVPDTWMVEDLPGTFGAPGGAFTIHEGLLEVGVRGADLEGEPAEITRSPRGHLDFLANRVTTGAGGSFRDVEAGFLPETRRWAVAGSIPPGDSMTLTLPQRDPVRLAVDALSLALEEGGVIVEGETRILWDPGSSREDGCVSASLPACASLLRLAGLRSVPLADLIPPIMSESHNWMAEQLLRTVGSEVGEWGSWEEGIQAILDYLEREVGLSPLDIHLRDGSGLSANNLLTPRVVVRTLRYAQEAPWGAGYREALAQPGETDSTLERRLSGLEGRVFAKTGSIRHVNALSGYLITEDGEERVFAILTNGSNLPADSVRDRIDRIVRELAAP